MDQDEDLTASHWDDVISPNTGSSFANLNSTYLPPSNDFNDLSIDDQSKNNEDDEDDDDEEEEDDENGTSNHNPNFSEPFADYGVNYARESEVAQMDQIKKEERDEHRSNLMSELTKGSEVNEIRESTLSPERIDSSSALFNDKDSPVKAIYNKDFDEKITSPNRPINLKSPYRGPRPRKYKLKTVVDYLSGSGNKKTKDNENSLGPLGNDFDDLNLEDKDASKQKNRKAEKLVQEANAPLYGLPEQKEEDRLNELGKAARENHSTQIMGSGSINSKDIVNKLEILVEDPMKVGDIATAHVVYSVKIKNKSDDVSETNFPVTDDYITVQRRYRDFRWIYHQLQSNHPGLIIPPPPTKQTYIGRFNESFVENRRLSLEKMLNKISSIPQLNVDLDFAMFLTSHDFINDSKEREKMSGSDASYQNNAALDNEHEGGDASSETSSVNTRNRSGSITAPVISTGSIGGGFMSSLFSMSAKISDPDEFFVAKRSYIEDLEHNLKNLLRSIELIGTQRIEMVSLYDEICQTVDELASLDILKVTSDLLSSFSDTQYKLKENLDRVNLQDQMTLGFTVEEYLRIIGSIKHTFDARMKIYLQYYGFNQELQKKETQLDKLNRKGKSQTDKINLLAFEVDKLKQRNASYEKQFINISDTIKLELERFEYQKIDDFRNSVEIYIESSLESQKEAIELWETFYEKQNLADV